MWIVAPSTFLPTDEYRMPITLHNEKHFPHHSLRVGRVTLQQLLFRDRHSGTDVLHIREDLHRADINQVRDDQHVDDVSGRIRDTFRQLAH